jgi:hypothetical protein
VRRQQANLRGEKEATTSSAFVAFVAFGLAILRLATDGPVKGVYGAPGAVLYASHGEGW